MTNDIMEYAFRLQNAAELNFPKRLNPIDPDLMSRLEELSEAMKFIVDKFNVNITNVNTDVRKPAILECNYESEEFTIYPHLSYKFIMY